MEKLNSLHLQFWDSESPVDVVNAKSPREVTVVKGDLTFFAHLQSTGSVKPQIISCGGRNSDVLNASDQNPSRKWISIFL